jgi:hypothetical protein
MIRLKSRQDWWAHYFLYNPEATGQLEFASQLWCKSTNLTPGELTGQSPFNSERFWLHTRLHKALRNILRLADGSDEMENVHALQILLQSIGTLAERDLGQSK